MGDEQCASVAAMFLPVEKLKIGVPEVNGSPVARIGRAGHGVDDQGTVLIDGDLHTGLRARADEHVDMSLDPRL